MSVLPHYAGLLLAPPEPPPPPPAGPAGAVSWPMGGGPGEAAFWAAVRRAEAASGHSLAAAMLGRGPGGPPPSRAELPTTINPMRFLLENRLAGGAVLARIKAGAAGPNRLSPGLLATLRPLLPPELLLLVQVEAAVPADGPADPVAPLPIPAPEPAAIPLGGESPLLVAETGDQPWIRRTESPRP